MLFQKPSLRTRVTFEAGMAQLGGHAIYLTNDVVLGARESVARRRPQPRAVRRRDRGPDGSARGRRGARRRRPTIPVINGLTPARAPVPGAGRRVHARASGSATLDGLVRRVRRRRQQRLPLARPARRRARAWRSGSPIPPGYAPERADRRARAASSRRRPAGGSSSATTRREVVRGADVVYTDAWTSMGQEAETEERRDAFAGYQVDDALLDAAGPDVARHALPAGPSRRGDHLRR